MHVQSARVCGQGCSPALVQGDLSWHPPDSEAQQEAVSAIAAEDAFNWGYDPVHWSTPEGSYASNPDGPTRVLEYRLMVQALHRMGLRVVFDTVYNHTFHSGVDGEQVLQVAC